MRTTRLFVPLAPLALFVTAAACGAVPDDPGARLFPPGGIIRGTVLYQGPRPCSRNGHIVGNAVMLVFDRRNPPPPNGLANTAVNFADVTGDVLFANEPRYTGPELSCPPQNETITASAPFEMGSVAGGSYMIQAFFDYTGDFLPTFKIRNLPEHGDVGGGYLDTADALKPINAGNVNYQPKFLPIDIGIPEPLPDLGKNPPPNPVPNFDLPAEGFVKDNVTVSIGSPLALTRPYFYPQGGGAFAADMDGNPAIPYGTKDQSADRPGQDPADGPNGKNGTLEDPGDPHAGDYEPILTIPQDIQVLAPPTAFPPPQGDVNNFESKFPHLRLDWGVPAQDGVTSVTPYAPKGFPELQFATDPTQPFHMQIAPFAASAQGGGFLVWQNAVNPTGSQYITQSIPEGQIPYLWPLVVLNKLADDPKSCDASGNCNYHPTDPASLKAQGDANTPVIVLQGITLLGTQPGSSQGAPPQGESVYWSALDSNPLGSALGASSLVDKSGNPIVFKQDHVTILLRPSVICFNSLFDATNPDKRGVLVTPYLKGDSADTPPMHDQPIVPTTLLTNTNPTIASVSSLVKNVEQGCLPTGRYAINLVYPTGQAWTVPNEAGACSGAEGATDYDNLTCQAQSRPVLYSQGTRAVVEITPTKDPTHCVNGGMPPPVPVECLPGVQQ